MGFLTTEAENFAVLRQVKERIDWGTFDSEEQLLRKLNEVAPALKRWVDKSVPWRLRGLYRGWIRYYEGEIKRRLKDQKMWREVDRAKVHLPQPPV